MARSPLANPILYKLYPLWAFMLWDAIGGNTNPTAIPTNIPSIIESTVYLGLKKLI